MPAGHPQGVPYFDELEAGTGLERRGEWYTDLDDPEVAVSEEKERYTDGHPCFLT